MVQFFLISNKYHIKFFKLNENYSLVKMHQFIIFFNLNHYLYFRKIKSKTSLIFFLFRLFILHPRLLTLILFKYFILYKNFQYPYKNLLIDWKKLKLFNLFISLIHELEFSNFVKK